MLKGSKSYPQTLVEQPGSIRDLKKNIFSLQQIQTFLEFLAGVKDKAVCPRNLKCIHPFVMFQKAVFFSSLQNTVS